MTEDFKTACDEIIQVGKEMYRKGLIVGVDGNISTRLEDGSIAITGSGFCKGALKPEDISLVDLRGTLLSGPKPARDLRMHLAVYREKEDARAVIHAHPPVITGFSATKYDFGNVIFPEALFNFNGISFSDYAVPISVDVSRKVTETLSRNPNSRAVVLANHGALTYGDTVRQAFYEMESVELVAKSTLVALLIGNVHFLDAGEREVVRLLLDGVSPDEICPPDENGL